MSKERVKWQTTIDFIASTALIILYVICSWGLVALVGIFCLGVNFFIFTLLKWWNPVAPQVAWMLNADYEPWLLLAFFAVAITGYWILQKIIKFLFRKDLL